MVKGVVHVRRQGGNAHFLALGNIAGNFGGRVQHGSHKGCHILPGVVAFEVRRLVGYHRIAHRVGLIEGIVGKGNDFIVQGLGSLLRYSVGDTAGYPLFLIAVYKNLPLRLDDSVFLFGDGPADIVRLSHSIAGQSPENLNHLLLVDDTAISNPQNRLQQRRFVGDFLGVQLIGNEGGNGVHGTGAVQCHNSRQVFDGVGVHIDAHAGNSGRFQLEYALGLSLRQHIKGFLVIVRNFGNVKIRLDLLNLLLGILNHRQVPQAQKVHFQKAQLLNGGHGILGHCGIIIFRQGHIGIHRVGGNHHTGGVGGGISGHSLQGHCRINELFHPLILVIHLFQSGRCFQGFFQSDMGGGRNLLCHHIRLSIGEIHGSAHIPDSTPGCHGAEGGNLGHMVRTVFFHDIGDDLAPALLAEVRIKVRHTHPFRVQKPLENQAVLHGIHFRNVQAVGNDGSGTGATARPHRNPRFLGIADKIPDNQVIVYIPHPADNANFIFQPLTVFRRRILIPLGKAVLAQLPEKFLIGIPLRNREGRQVVLVKLKVQVAALGDFFCILKSLRAVGKQLPQFLFAF